MSMLLDIKYALRLLFKAPKFTAMTLSVLIGGLSISLFTFSFLYSSIYKDLPLPEGETALVMQVLNNNNYRFLAGNEYLAMKDDLNQFSEFGIYKTSDIRLSLADSGKSISGSYVGAGFFEFSRIKPFLGRTIQADDIQASAEPVVVISYEIWQNEFNGNKAILTNTILLNNVVTNVIGVMPPHYRFPNYSQLWLPLKKVLITNNIKDPSTFLTYARLKQNVTIKQAEQQISQTINQIYQQNVKRYDLPALTKSVRLLSFPMAQMGGQGPIIFIFLNIVAWLILLLACINVGNLLLARAIERQKETAIRAALGASSKRLVSQLMWEGIIIASLGGILSILLVGAALDYFEIIAHSWLPKGGSFWWHWGIDIETVLMALVFTLVTIFFAVFVPSWRAAHQDINTTLRDGTRGAQGKKAGRLSRFLVTTQIFIVALLMLIGGISGYIANTFINLDLGDNYQNVIRADVDLSSGKYKEETQKISFYQSILNELAQSPQVSGVYMNDRLGALKLTIPHIDYAAESEHPDVDTLSIFGDIKTIGVNLVAGRQFTRQDKKGARQVAMISQSMANRYWQGKSPLEQVFKLTIDDKVQTFFVVGVVSDRMNPSTLFGKLDAADEIYLSTLQFVLSTQSIYYRVQTMRNAEDIFYHALFAIDRNIELTYPVQPAEKNRSLMRDGMRLTSNITFGTGFVALLLALIGIYGLTANAVAQRTHEIGIRRAVGATDSNIITLFFKQGIKQLIIGIGLALAIFVLIAIAFNSVSDGLFPQYLYVLIASVVSISLFVVVMLAIYAPTQRAIKMEPSVALRYE